MRKQRDRTISPDLPTEMTVAKTPESGIKTPVKSRTPLIQISPPESPDTIQLVSPPQTAPVPITLQYSQSPQTLQEICEKIESLTRPILAELKSYTSPPQPVHKTMTAVFLLLGEDHKFLKDWNNILILMKAGGGDSLMSRLGQFTAADNKVMKDVRKLIQGMTLEEVKSAGRSVSHLFNWVCKVCYENL